MLHDFFAAILRSKSLVSVLPKEAADEADELIAIFDLIMAPVGEDNLRVANFAHQHLLVAIEERSHSDEHLVDQNAYSPPVH